MKNIIPGHVRAVTWMAAMVLSVVMYAVKQTWEPVVGSLILTTGFFLVDQATHLVQEDHSAPPPTWIEQMQQGHRVASVALGLTLIGISAYMIVS